MPHTVIKPKLKNVVLVASLPKCDLCHLVGETHEACYDAKLPSRGYWANVCRSHFDREECELGVGKGQYLTTIPEVSNV